MVKNIVIVVSMLALICATACASCQRGHSTEDGEKEVTGVTVVDLQGEEVLAVLQEARAKDHIEQQDDKYKIVLRGEVTEISGQVVTLSRKYDPLSHGNDPLSLYVNEGAEIFVAKEKIGEYRYSMRMGKFEEIKINDLVSIWAELEPDKPLQVLIVRVFQGSLKPPR